jgi:hypothetical protein
MLTLCKHSVTPRNRQSPQRSHSLSLAWSQPCHTPLIATPIAISSSTARRYLALPGLEVLWSSSCWHPAVPCPGLGKRVKGDLPWVRIPPPPRRSSGGRPNGVSASPKRPWLRVGYTGSNFVALGPRRSSGGRPNGVSASPKRPWLRVGYIGFELRRTGTAPVVRRTT